MLRWLEPEDGRKEGDHDHRALIEHVQQIVAADEQRIHIENIAKSRTAGIWRIKRAKILLGALEGKSVRKMVMGVRVPPESIIRCLEGFSSRGMEFFKTPDRQPTSREARVENLLRFLENPPSKRSLGWDTVTAHYIGHDFSARQIHQIRELITSQPDTNPSALGLHICRLFKMYQSDGNYKFSQIKDILKRMDMDNVIFLPNGKPPSYAKRRPRNNANRSVISTLSTQSAARLEAHDVRHLQFIPVYSEKDSALWREMIERFHYIKTTRLFGAQIRYLVYGDGALPGTLDFLKSDRGMMNQHWAARYNDAKRGKHLLAALGFASAPWRLSSREHFIGWSDSQREANLKLVMNNGRVIDTIPLLVDGKPKSPSHFLTARNGIVAVFEHAHYENVGIVPTFAQCRV